MSKNQGGNPSYSISQNFLTSRRTIDKLIAKADLTSADTVIEIGAGKGHITKALSQKCKSVISYEIDKNLFAKLKPQLNKNVKLYCGDFLKCSLPKTPYKVFANIPFSKTTEIVRKLTSSSNVSDGIWLVMEKGAAKRFCGIPSENLNSLSLKPFFDLKIVWHFDRNDFHPSPRADVVMLEMKPKRPADIPFIYRNDFRMFLTKGSKNGVYGSRGMLTKKQVSTALRLTKLPMIPHSGKMSYVQWLCLFRYILSLNNTMRR